MKYDMDCAHCKRPARKCHGGNFRTPYTDRECLPTRKPHEGPTPEFLPAHKRLADIEYIGVMYCTSCGDLNLGDRYMTNILKQLLADKAPFDSFAGRVRLIVEEVSMSRGIPEAPEKEDEEK